MKTPEKYMFNYDYCMFLHDLLVEIIKSGESAEIFNIQLNLNEEQTKFLEENKINGIEFINWMEENGFHQEKKELYFRQLFIALLSDFCHFIFESLNCARKHKMTVAYALLRKPLKDNLIFLEWLAGNPMEFINDFDSEEGLFKIASDNIESQKKVTIIENAMLRSYIGKWIDPHFIYELRYDKKSLFGFEPLFQTANHLITNNRHYKTEYANMNFIFSDSEATETQLDQYFSLLPAILFNTFHIVESTVLEFSRRQYPERDAMIYLRSYIGLIMSIDKMPWNISKNSCNEDLLDILTEDLKCLTCSNKLELKKQDYSKIYQSGKILCRHCKKKTDLISF